ncbi:MAG TPA: DUF504 domain-containing protein [Clostridia bacterium]|nr:DUF504 domain-containing protein [Clostridia bacterium]
MIPIHELLNRIRWDAEFAKGKFELGYFDRVENRVILLPFKEVLFLEADRHAFRILGTDGKFHRVPFHRVREVYKDSQRIWCRAPEANSTP